MGYNFMPKYNLRNDVYFKMTCDSFVVPQYAEIALAVRENEGSKLPNSRMSEKLKLLQLGH